MSYTNEQVCHLWANQSKDSATSGHGNVYFTGRKLYSYGSHYLLGIILPDGTSFINQRSYSNTTAKHRSYAWRAVRYSNAFGLPDLTEIGDAILSAAMERASFRQQGRADVRSYLEEQAHKLEPGAVAYLLRLVGSRADPEKFRAAAYRKQQAAKERSERALQRQNRAAAARTAGTSLEAFRDRLARISGQDQWNAKRNLESLAKDLFHEHRAAGGKRIKAAVWQRLKLTRAAIDRLERLGPGRKAARQAIRNLRGALSGDADRNGGFSGPLAFRRSHVGTSFIGWIESILRNAPAVSPDLRAKLEAAQTRLGRLAALASRREDRQRAARLAREQAERFAREAETRRAWLAGESPQHTFRGSDERGGALLRAVGAEVAGCEVRAGTLQTSHGADVPLAHAFRLFRFIKGLRQAGQDWQESHGIGGQRHEGRPAHIRVGHFRVDWIDKAGNFKAGCHLIHWPEIERLATELGVFDCPATVEPTEVISE